LRSKGYITMADDMNDDNMPMGDEDEKESGMGDSNEGSDSEDSGM